MTQKRLLKLLARNARFRAGRGGSWCYLDHDCRSACRNHYAPDSRDQSLGFRVVCIRRNHDSKTNA